MDGDWSTHFTFFLSVALASAIPIGLGCLRFLVSPAPKKRIGGAPKREPIEPTGTRFNVRYLAAAIAACALLGIALLLVPSAVTLKDSRSRMEALGALAAIGWLSVVSAAILLYSGRKGDLGWIRSYGKKAGS